MSKNIDLGNPSKGSKNIMTKEQIIDKIVKDLPIKEMRNKMTNAEWYGWFLESWNEAINNTDYCETLPCSYAEGYNDAIAKIKEEAKYIEKQ